MSPKTLESDYKPTLYSFFLSIEISFGFFFEAEVLTLLRGKFGTKAFCVVQSLEPTALTVALGSFF